jgi:hypothetical protein
MKRKTIAAVLGAVGLAATSYGQGYINFNNYEATPYYAVMYGTQGQGIPALLAGTAAGPEVSVEMGYEFGTQTSFTLVPSSITPISGTISAPDNGVGPSIGGWYLGPTITIPGYASGSVTFEAIATVNSGAAAGDSGKLIWTEPATAIATGLSAPGFFTGLTGDLVIVGVPEPTTLALAGLGGAALLALRRKKA